jgi:hypothetical protein
LFIIHTPARRDIAFREAHDQRDVTGVVRERRDLPLDRWVLAYGVTKAANPDDDSAEN